MSKGIQSVERALSIIELFNEKIFELGTQEISEQLMLPKSTVNGLIKTLESKHYLTQNPDNKKYKLGICLFKLGSLVSQSFDLKKVASPYIKDVSSKVNETVHLVLYKGNEALYIDKEGGAHSLRMYSQVGKTAPLYCTGVGKAILAFLNGEELENVLINTKMKAFTKNTKINQEEIKEEIELIKQQGYAIDDEEIELGLFCIAAPIFDHRGKVIGSIALRGQKIDLINRKGNSR